MLVAEGGAKGMSVHVTPEFEELVMPVQALGQYIKATRCLPLYAATRCVVLRPCVCLCVCMCLCLGMPLASWLRPSVCVCVRACVPRPCSNMPLQRPV